MSVTSIRASYPVIHVSVCNRLTEISLKRTPLTWIEHNPVGTRVQTLVMYELDIHNLDQSDSTLRRIRGREREMFNLTTHSTHFIYGYMASDIWLRTILIVRKETRCRHIGYSYRLTARALLYAPSHRQDNTYHGFCYTSRGALAGTRNSPMGA